MNCINTKSKEFQELLEASKLPSILLEMRVAKWQEQNGLESFPKVEDIIQSNEVDKTFEEVDFTDVTDNNIKQFDSSDLENKLMVELKLYNREINSIRESDKIFSKEQIAEEKRQGRVVKKLKALIKK